MTIEIKPLMKKYYIVYAYATAMGQSGVGSTVIQTNNPKVDTQFIQSMGNKILAAGITQKFISVTITNWILLDE